MQPEEQSYTVLRGKFDQWFMEKAESAGAQPIPGVRVEELIVRDGKVCGVKAGEDELEAHVGLARQNNSQIFLIVSESPKL